jgi:hypothetical protein
MVFTRDPATGSRNVGMYRLQVFDERTLGMHWQIHKGSAEHQRLAEERGKPMEVAIALGGDPASIYSASAPLPPGIDEMVFSGWLRGAGVPMVTCKTVDVEVPAEAEIVLEGTVDPLERRMEGPFGDHTGYYSLAREYPVFHLKAVTRRTQPIYPTTIVGRPPQEDYWLGKATERIFLPIIRLMLPEVVDMNMPAEGVFHNLVIVSIRKRYPGQARKVMYALWGLGLMMLAKNILVVSEHVDVQNLSEVAWRPTGNVDPKRDIVIGTAPPTISTTPPSSLRGQDGHRRHGRPPTTASAARPSEIAHDEETRALVRGAGKLQLVVPAPSDTSSTPSSSAHRFALPFACVGWFSRRVAGQGRHRSGHPGHGQRPHLAASVNRLADRLIDAANPRGRAPPPAGLLRPWHMLLAALVAGGLLGLSAWMLNPLCFRLAPLAALFLIGYSYTKRFTWASHWILGFTDGIAAAGGWIAVRGVFEPPAFVLWFALTVWIALGLITPARTSSRPSSAPAFVPLPLRHRRGPRGRSDLSSPDLRRLRGPGSADGTGVAVLGRGDRGVGALRLRALARLAG